MDDERLHRVLSGALRIWGVSGTVASDPEHAGCFIVSSGTTRLHVNHLSQGGWLVRSEDRVDEHAGIPGLLRTLRAELAPHAPAGRLIIGS